MSFRQHLAPVMGAALLLGSLLLAASAAPAQEAPAQETPRSGLGKERLEIEGGTLLWSGSPRPTFEGVTGAPADSVVTVTLEMEAGQEPAGGASSPAPQQEQTTVGERGNFGLVWPRDLAAGGYEVTVAVTAEENSQRVLAQARATLVVQLGEGLPRRPLVAPPLDYAPPFEPAEDRFEAFTDRWRIVPPPYELNADSSRWDPYNQNVLKGDYPVKGDDIFFILTGISDTLVQGMNLPTPAGVSTAEPGSIDFFGEDGQLFLNQNVVISAELFRGDTAFRPMDWRVKATLVGNVNHLETQENAVVKPDVREGTDRTDGRASLQEFFVEKKLADLSTSYDFLSLRVGIQPFSSDFRGFVFTDTNLALRLFGNADSNRWQYNLYLSERLEKDTNSGLNLFELRDQQVAVANVYRQDTFALGWTHQLSLHYLRDEPTFFFDRNGFLARPDPVGSFTPHEVEALYLGWTSFGHSGRLNIDHALYYVTGEDSLNPIAGEDLFAGRSDVDISAFFGALELSIDRNWYRPKLSLLYASGDDSPTDRDAEGFDAIFENPAFAGGGFSFWNRLGIRLAGTGTGLVNRGSLLPNLRSSKEEGQPNFVNPGLLLASAGLDLELTPELKAVATANYLRFDSTEAIQLLLFQSQVDEEIGWDLSLGARWRPYLNNNVTLLAGVAAFLPGAGFEDIYQSDDNLYMGFVNLTLTF